MEIPFFKTRQKGNGRKRAPFWTPRLSLTPPAKSLRHDRTQPPASRLFQSISTFVGTLVFVSVSASAQQLGQSPSSSSGGLIAVQASDPRMPPNSEFPSILFRIKSLTGQPVRIAAPIYLRGWEAYTSSGVICREFAVPILPTVDNNGNSIRPETLTAGVNAPALIPVSVFCNGIKRGDELSMSIVLLVEQNGRWVSKQIAVDQKIIK